MGSHRPWHLDRRSQRQCLDNNWLYRCSMRVRGGGKGEERLSCTVRVWFGFVAIGAQAPSLRHRSLRPQGPRPQKAPEFKASEPQAPSLRHRILRPQGPKIQGIRASGPKPQAPRHRSLRPQGIGAKASEPQAPSPRPQASGPKASELGEMAAGGWTQRPGSLISDSPTCWCPFKSNDGSRCSNRRSRCSAVDSSPRAAIARARRGQDYGRKVAEAPHAAPLRTQGLL